MFMPGVTSISGLVLDVKGDEEVEVRGELASGGPEMERRDVKEVVVLARLREAEKKRFAKALDVEDLLSGGFNGVKAKERGDVGPRWSRSACWAMGQSV
jgi:hypothetical protein